MLRELLKNGENLKQVSRWEFERLLTPPGDSFAKLSHNPFSRECVEPAEINPVRMESHPASNHLTYHMHSYTRPFGQTLNGGWVEKFEKEKHELPEGADAWFCWPKLSVIAEKVGASDPYVLDYGACVRFLIRETNPYRTIHVSDQASGLNADQLRLLPSVSRFYKEWEQKTKGDYMIAALQLGGLYAGCSPRNARYQMLNAGQFPLDPYVVACLLLADSSLLYLDDTNIDCPGAEYARYAGGIRSDILTLETSYHNPVMHLFDQGAHPGKMRCASGFVPEGMRLKL